jgi:hypothetical protein
MKISQKVATTNLPAAQSASIRVSDTIDLAEVGKQMEEFEDQIINDPYKEPPIGGELWLSVPVAPVSLQSKKEARSAF